MSEQKSVFNTLNNVDVSGLTKKKGKFDYLSWSNAVREASKLYPEMIWTFTSWGDLPYLKTELGFFVECCVIINGISKTQMMPVLDYSNKATMSPSANDINKSQMRTLAKAIALHGLGLDLWAGEDINGEYESDGTQKVDLMITAEQAAILSELMLNEDGQPNSKGWQLIKAFKITHITEIKAKDYDKILQAAK